MKTIRFIAPIIVSLLVPLAQAGPKQACLDALESLGYTIGAYTFEKAGWISKEKHIFNGTVICYIGKDKGIHSIEDNGIVIVEDGFFGQETLAKRDELNAERKQKIRAAKRKMEAEFAETKRRINDTYNQQIQELKQSSKPSAASPVSARPTTEAPATVEMTAAPQDTEVKRVETKAAGRILAEWKVEFGSTIRAKNTLVYRGGLMVLETRYSDGSSGSREVIERPVDMPNTRRFDLEKGSDRSEYITVSSSGDVEYFSWEGRKFESISANSISEEFLVVGVNPVVRECVPKVLSHASKEAIRLYGELQTFKNDPEFARMGFARAGIFYPWLKTIKDLHSQRGLETLDELGFLAGDVMQLGMEYMSVATSGEEPNWYIQDMERTIQSGLALATCRSGFNS